MRLIDDLLREALSATASDIHITEGRPPLFRVDGHLSTVGDTPLSSEEATEMLKTLLQDSSRLAAELKEKKQTDFSYALPDGTRFRVNVFRHLGVLSAALRLIPNIIRTVDDLHLPPQIIQFADLKQGFVIMAGPAGHGKSTTMAALVEYINHHRKEHIITIEDPIEYQFTDKESIIDQRELGRDAPSFAEAIRATLRQDPNIIMIGELRDLESMRTAITVAETGHLVFATLHTNDAAQTVERLIDSFPAEQQSQVRSQLSATLSGVLSMRLLPWNEGGRIPAVEIMIATTAIRNVIREGHVHQIMGIIQTSADVGMQTMDASLQALIDSGAVQFKDAQPYFSSAKALSR